ncbi:DUF7269 family protein [Halopiger thermotolerans]
MAAGTTVRTALLAVGGCSLSAGLVLVANPSVAALIRWPWDAELLLVACFTLVLVIGMLLGTLGTWDLDDPSASEPDVPERVPTAPAPGHDLERIVDRRWPVTLPPARRRRLRERMRETTVRTLVRTTGCDRAAAETKIVTGTWTDDSVAAEFVRPDADPDRSRTRLESLWDRLRFTRRLRRAATAVSTLETEKGEDR